MAGSRHWVLFAALILAFILIPFFLWEQPLVAWSERLLSSSSHGVLAGAVVCLLCLDVALPIPSSFVAASSISALGAVAGGAAVWLGLTLAALVGYVLGRVGGIALATRIAGERELARARTVMAHHGIWVLLLCRGVPVIAEVSTLFAGVAMQPMRPFVLITGVGNLGVTMAYAAIALFDLAGPATLIAPFAFALGVPWLCFLLARALGIVNPLGGDEQLPTREPAGDGTDLRASSFRKG